jgi:hypothetical protein
VGADIGKTLLHTGSHLIDDAVAGRNFKDSARNRLSAAGKDIVNHSIHALKSQVGLGRGKRKRRSASSRKKTINKKRKTVQNRKKNPKKKKKSVKRRSSKVNINRFRANLKNNLAKYPLFQ